MNNNPAKYLDKILKVLAENFGSSLTIQELENRINPMEIPGMKMTAHFSPYLLRETTHALEYLQKLNLISKDLGGAISITFEGYIKIKTKGFAQEIREKSFNQMLQRIAWIVPILISFAALLVASKKTS